MTEEELDLKRKDLAFDYSRAGGTNEINLEFQTALANYQWATDLDPGNKTFIGQLERVASKITILLNT